MNENNMPQPSDETIKKMLNFFLDTSVPRILEEKGLIDSIDIEQSE